MLQDAQNAVLIIKFRQRAIFYLNITCENLGSFVCWSKSLFKYESRVFMSPMLSFINDESTIAKLNFKALP